MTSVDDFTHRPWPYAAHPVHRLGLALNYGLDARGFDASVERGINCFFYTKLRTGASSPRSAASSRRDASTTSSPRDRPSAISPATCGAVSRRGWSGPVMTAGDCYRFCLSSPHVDVALTGPSDDAQLIENLDAVERGPLSTEELGWMREFGAAVHG